MTTTLQNTLPSMDRQQFPTHQRATEQSQRVSQTTSHSAHQADTTYIGLATLVPADLRALCTCAHLFFARVQRWCADGELVRVEIAALPHYFAAEASSRQKHVHTIMLSAEQFAQLVEYDRHLAGIATCDVRELVTEHVTAHAAQSLAPCHPSLQHPRISQSTASAGASSTSPTLRQIAPVPLAPKASQSPLLWCEGPAVTIPLNVLRVEADAAAFHESARSSAHGPVPFAVLILRAALDILSAERQQETDQRERKHLTRQLREVRRVLVARREIPPKVAVTPFYQRGRDSRLMGCTVHIGVPLHLAA